MDLILKLDDHGAQALQEWATTLRRSTSDLAVAAIRQFLSDRATVREAVDRMIERDAELLRRLAE